MPKKTKSEKQRSTNNARLLNLGAQYSEHLLSLSSQSLAACEAKARGGWSSTDEARFEAKQNQALEALHDIAWKAAEKRAASLAALAVKVKIILDHCDREYIDLKEQLVISMCDDIVALSDKEGLDI